MKQRTDRTVAPVEAPNPGRSDTDRSEQPADPDADLVTLISHGAGRRALEQLTIRYGAAVYRLCCVALRDRVLAEDVHQHIFLEICRRIERFEPRIPLRAWLFWCARNGVANAKRARARERSHLTPEGSAASAERMSSPTTRRDAQALRRALETTIAQLPDDLHHVLLLRVRDELSFDEIAQVMGEPANTLQRRLSRAMPRLRRDLRRTLIRLARFSAEGHRSDAMRSTAICSRPAL